MTHIVTRAFAATAFVATSALAAPTEMYTPALYANPPQFLECRIVNVSGAAQTVTIEAFMSTGAVGAGPSTQTLAPGEAGGFSVPGYYANLYCKFTVPGKSSGYRVSIDVLELDPVSSTKIVVALPGF